jgi:hypothetical protein
LPGATAIGVGSGTVTGGWYVHVKP